MAERRGADPPGDDERGRRGGAAGGDAHHRRPDAQPRRADDPRSPVDGCRRPSRPGSPGWDSPGRLGVRRQGQFGRAEPSVYRSRTWAAPRCGRAGPRPPGRRGIAAGRPPAPPASRRRTGSPRRRPPRVSSRDRRPPAGPTPSPRRRPARTARRWTGRRTRRPPGSARTPRPGPGSGSRRARVGQRPPGRSAGPPRRCRRCVGLRADEHDPHVRRAPGPAAASPGSACGHPCAAKGARRRRRARRRPLGQVAAPDRRAEPVAVVAGQRRPAAAARASSKPCGTTRSRSAGQPRAMRSSRMA